MPQYLFSYGTLQPEFARGEIASLVRSFRSVGGGWVSGLLYDLGAYPGAVLRATQAKVFGQVFELPQVPRVLNRLDEYEGFSPMSPDLGEFARQECEVTLENDEAMRAWVYVYNRDPGALPRIAHGDYVKFRKSPQV